MDVSAAIQIKTRALAAVAELDSIVAEARERCSDQEFQILRRGVGRSIGYIATEILEPVLQQFPEIDDLRE